MNFGKTQLEPKLIRKLPYVFRIKSEFCFKRFRPQVIVRHNYDKAAHNPKIGGETAEHHHSQILLTILGHDNVKQIPFDNKKEARLFVVLFLG